MLAGANEDAPQVLKAVLAPQRGAATLLFGRSRASGPEAAWINGTAVTVVVDNKTAFTHVFAARVIYGEAYGLNKGLVGFGSNNSRGYFDNIAIQILPPKITLDHQESFDDGTADVFAPVDGTWSTSGGAYIAGPIDSTSCGPRHC